MKRGMPRHPKTIALYQTQKISWAAAVGHMELLWHFTAEFAPQGNIGKFDDKYIGAAIGWTGAHGCLVEALVTVGWVDLDPSWRLLTHDWGITSTQVPGADWQGAIFRFSDTHRINKIARK